MVTIETESLTDALIGEILPLAQKCWQESTEQKLQTCAYFGEREFAVEPDTDWYKRLQASGVLVVMTMRDGSKLVGYLIGILYNSWHHKGILCANGDTIYVDPDYRGNTPSMIRRFEKDMTDRGVKIIGWPTTQGGPVYELLKTMGFVGDDIIMEKRCAS